MKKVSKWPLFFRVLLAVGLLASGLLLLNVIEPIGFICLLLGLFFSFESFGLSLFYKIAIALTLGTAFAVTGLISGEQFLTLKPIGSKIFLNLLTLALVPLVFSSILTGVTQLADMTKLQRIGTRAILYFLSTTVVAVMIGLTVSNIFSPGKGLGEGARQMFEQSAEGTSPLDPSKKVSLYDVVQNLVPSNILSAVSQSRPDMLAIILFAILCGIALLRLPADKAKPVIAFFEGINEMVIQLIMMVMWIAPYGVFAIIGSTLSQSKGAELLMALLPFSLVVLAGLFLHACVISFVSLRFFSKRPILETLLAIKDVLLTAFSTASSGATMPFTMSVAEKRLGVKKEVSSFVISLGATINMDGSSLFQGVAAIFLANLYGVDLSFIDQITIVVMALLASIGTAAVPGVALVMLMMILTSVGVPSEGILFILPVNHILDMFRTAVNVLGDLCCAMYIDKVESKQ